jgi:hypothetical protein
MKRRRRSHLKRNQQRAADTSQAAKPLVFHNRAFA